VFIRSQKGKTSEWLINSDATGLRELAPRGISATWSADGQWVYYTVFNQGDFCVEKVPVEGGTPQSVRCNGALPAAFSADNSTLYFTNLGPPGSVGKWGYLCKAHPETGPSETLARVSGLRVPVKSTMLNPVLSPDGRWLAVPLVDGPSANIWLFSASDGAAHAITDFGQRPVLITRRVCWSPDGRHIYAAVADVDADVVLMDGLLPGAVSHQ
jgi:Tol biopolymer transport system component